MKTQWLPSQLRKESILNCLFIERQSFKKERLVSVLEQLRAISTCSKILGLKCVGMKHQVTIYLEMLILWVSLGWRSSFPHKTTQIFDNYWARSDKLNRSVLNPLSTGMGHSLANLSSWLFININKSLTSVPTHRRGRGRALEKNKHKTTA